MNHKSSKWSSSWKIALSISAKNKNKMMTPPPGKSSTTSHLLKTKVYTLEEKYGRLSKTISDEGASGIILLVTRPCDNELFAVKRFRRREHIEDDKSYIRKIVAEYYIGSRLHHPNIMKTLELFQEHDRWFSVMGYAPYCLFDRVMSRKMSTAEVNCAFMQILAGTNHLHLSGFVHRDLKLENVVITEEGIMKIIDFGCATLCEESGLKCAFGLVGSRPYMAPEVLTNYAYEPQKADVWSLAIIYCCMVFGHFPWKSPDISNEAFALFATIELGKAQLSVGSTSKISSTSSSAVKSVSHTNKRDEKLAITEKVVGPEVLLRRLPSESRDVVRVMLAIKPEMRPNLQRVMRMPWTSQVQHCSEDGDGNFVGVDGHQHKG